MKKIEASKLNRSLKEVLDAVAKGDKYEVTRYGKVVAKILPPGARQSWQDKALANDHLEPVDMKVSPEVTVAGKQLTPEEIRQKRRDYLYAQINKPKKDG